MEKHGGAVMNGTDGRRALMKLEFSVHSRNGRSRFLTNSAHTLLEAFREPLDSC